MENFYSTGSGTTLDPRKYFKLDASNNAIEIQGADIGQGVNEMSIPDQYVGMIKPLPAGVSVPGSRVVRYPTDTSGSKVETTGISELQKARNDLYGDPESRTAMTEEGKTSIRNKVRDEFQSYIDAVNASYQNLFAQEGRAGEQRAGRTRASAANAGTLGMTFGNAAMNTMDTYNDEQLAALETKKQLDIQKIYGKINEVARKDIELEMASRDKNAEDYIKSLEANQTESRGMIDTLAATGMDIKELDNKRYADLLKTSGYDPLTFSTIWNSKLPESLRKQYQTVDTQLPNGNFGIMKIGYDPKTKQPLAPETYDFGVKYSDVKGKYPGGYKEVDGVLYGLQQDGSLVPLTKKTNGLKDMPSSYQEWSLAGGTKGTGLEYGDWLKRKDTSGAGFKPTADEKSAVNRYLGTLPGVTPEDFKKVETDSGFFYGLLQKAVTKESFNIQPFKYPYIQ